MTPAIRTRFAPSPTGFLHLGSLRTALYNYLFAKASGGKFILRIEDTDMSRYVAGAQENVENVLLWAGLTWDEGPKVGGNYGPYTQELTETIFSNRVVSKIRSLSTACKFPIKCLAQRFSVLHQAGHAYRCFCSKERLDSLKIFSSFYDRHCTHIDHSVAERRAAVGESHVIRLRAPEKVPRIDDLVYGSIDFNKDSMDDIILIKSDGFPTYHLANVIDDHHMEISTVIRGEEWLPSTPKHIALYSAFNWKPPHFAHVPLLVNPDGTKLSKRSGDIHVEQFIKKGCLPDALLNYLALLGWSIRRKNEVVTVAELANIFSIDRLTRGAATVMPEKLRFFNQEHIRMKANTQAGFDQLTSICKTLLFDTFGEVTMSNYSEAYIRSVVNASLEKLTALEEFPHFCRYMFVTPTSDFAGLPKSTDCIISLIYKALHTLDGSNWTVPNLKNALKSLCNEKGFQNKDVMTVTRRALTGTTVGIDTVVCAEILGKKVVLDRIYAFQTCFSKIDLPK